jgi:DNA-directed RNA polymerase specialized sigma24 family protein
MARSKKVKDPGVTNAAPGSPAKPGTAGSGTAGGCTSRAQLGAIHDSTGEKLRVHLLKCGVTSRDMDEVKQRTALGLVEWGGQNDPRQPGGLVCTTGGIQAKAFFREEARHPRVRGDDGDDEDAAPSSQDGLEPRVLRAQRMQILARGRAKLSRADRVVIDLIHAEGLSQAEAADKLGITLDAFESRYRRALARLETLVHSDCSKDDLGASAGTATPSGPRAPRRAHPR